MGREHTYFGLTVALMFLAPRLPMTLFSGQGPSKSTVSLAIVGLVLWGLSRGPLLFRQPSDRGPAPYFLMWFSVYAMLVTMASMNLLNTIYSLQYFLYAFLSALLLSGYIRRASAKGEMDRVVQVVVWVGAIYALGVIVSYWTGPFYPYQVLDYGRRWAGMLIMQGVGFGVNQNAVGGLLMVMFSATALLYRTSNIKWLLFFALYVVAISLTVSRAAILGAVVGALSMFLPFALHAGVKVKVTRRYMNVALGAVVVSVGLATVFAFYFWQYEDVKNSIMEGFGLGQSNILESETGRLAAIKRGLDVWLDGTPVQFVFGQGFKSSAVVSDVAVHTAHNFFVSVLGDFGLVGLMLFAIPYIALMGHAMVLSAKGSRVGLMALWSLSGLLFMNFTESYYYGVEFLFLLTLLAMLIFEERGRMQSAPGKGGP